MNLNFSNNVVVGRGIFAVDENFITDTQPIGPNNTFCHLNVRVIVHHFAAVDFYLGGSRTGLIQSASSPW